MDRVHVATLNIRNLADRWFERLPLLLNDMSALQPDLLGLQEVVYPMQQDRLIGAAGEGRYATHRAWAGRPEYGNALLVREPLAVSAVERLDLVHDRSALRALIGLPGADVLMVVTHLHHARAGENIRDEQTAMLLSWLADGPRATATVMVGDFNANPGEAALGRIRADGFRSAYAAANGEDPAVTWPSGLVAEAPDTDGDPACLDYIWVRGSVRVESARLCFDRPAPDELTLYPSDHLGVTAWLEVG
jgi:endonuclease/exonuclease/phosphatase family metal-dependent hydrolase